MAYSDNFPAVRPVFQADFANGGRIDPRATFTRSDTPPTYASPSAVHYWSNEKHLSSENLVLESENYDISPWVRNSLTPTGSQTAPDGSSNAWLLTPTAGTNPIRIQQAITLEANTAYTASCYMKAGAATHGFMSVRGTSSHYAQVTVDFSDPTNPSSSGVNFTSVSATSTAVGSTGWYRVVLNFTSSSVVTSERIHISPTDGTGPSSNGVVTWTSAGNETMYLWAVQLNTTGAKTYDSPTTTQISRSYAPSLKSVATAGQPRFEYSTDGQSAAKGILIESQSTNLVTRSHELDNAGWTKANLDVDANAAISVDGTLTADLLRPTTASTPNHYALTTVATTASSTYTASAYLKPAGHTKVQAFFYQTSSPFTKGADTTFTLSGSGSATTSQGSATIDSVGGGYYRVSVTGVAGTTSTYVVIRILDDSGNSSFAGDGYSGIICTGVQFELGSHCSSLISTSGSAATRASESLSMTDSGLFGTGSGAVVVEAGPVSGTFYPTLFDLTDTTTSNRVLLQSGGTGTPTSLTVAADGNASVGVVSEAVTMSDRKFAVSYDTNSFKLVNNGGAVSEDTSGQLPQQLSMLNIGTDNGGGGPLNGHVKRIAVFGEPLSNSNLQAITS